MSSRRVQTPANTLRVRLDRGKATAPLLDRGAIEAADAAMDTMGDDFHTWVHDQIKQIRFIANNVESGAMDWSVAITSLRQLAGEIAGLGSTCGYPLLTEICQSLLSLLSGPEALNPRTIGAIGAHADSLIYVHAKKMQEDGGTAGEHLLDSLNAVTEKIRSERT